MSGGCKRPTRRMEKQPQLVGRVVGDAADLAVVKGHHSSHAAPRPAEKGRSRGDDADPAAWSPGGAMVGWGRERDGNGAARRGGG